MGTRIIITNATILTLDGQDTFLYPSVLEIRDDRIYDIREGSTALLDDDYNGPTEVIDGTDKLVMPGLVDLHFHTSIAKVSGQARAFPHKPSSHSPSGRATATMRLSGSTSTKSGTRPSAP